MKKEDIFQSLTGKIKAVAEDVNDNGKKLEMICRLLRDIPGYDWVGFYLVNPGKDNELILGPYAGEPTEHVKIPFGKGICGRAAETREVLVVADVSRETNYLSCNANVKSEIVLPIFKKGKLVGQLDIDSHTLAAFTESDQRFLSRVCQIVSPLL
jgi:GAF domain-containing protein